MHGSHSEVQMRSQGSKKRGKSGYELRSLLEWWGCGLQGGET